MKAFHGDEAVKAKYVARLKAHHAADEIIQGTGWENGHGCAVGCTLNKYDHAAYETELGLPQWLARLQDRIFEGLPAGEAQQFAVEFLDAIPVGANVGEVRFKLAAARGRKTLEAQAANPADYAKQCVAAIELVIAYCADPLRTESQRSAARSAAESAAWSAAESAAESAARSAAWSAAESAAWSAAESAESAAWSAAESAESAASDHYKWEAAALIELLRAAPQAE